MVTKKQFEDIIASAPKKKELDYYSRKLIEPTSYL